MTTTAENLDHHYPININTKDIPLEGYKGAEYKKSEDMAKNFPIFLFIYLFVYRRSAFIPQKAQQI